MNMVAKQATGNKAREQIRRLYERMSPCRLCPRECGVDRLGGETGICRSSVRPSVASVNLHHGEEPPISGRGGSGTIFFSGCNLSCVFCQNYPISQMGVGKQMTVVALALKMLKLQDRGAENINFVTPTHFAAQTAHAVYLARNKGLTLPIVYNCSGYDSLETVKLLDRFIDIYLCDYRYASQEPAKAYSNAEDYPQVAEDAIGEMIRQVGNFNGKRGVIVRHLCLPSHLDETAKAIKRLKETFGQNLPISLMTQFFPAYKSRRFHGLDRRLNEAERREAWKILKDAGFESGWVQEDECD